MHLRYIGGAHDGTGFALAGVDSVECRSRAELVDALDAARRDPLVAVIVVGAEAATLAEDVIAGMRDAARLPITVVLPGRRPQREGAVA